MLVENCKEECTMMKRAIFDCVVELRHLERGQRSWIHRKTKLARDGSNFFCSTSQKSSNSFSHRSRKSQGSSPQHLRANKRKALTETESNHHRSWILSTSIVSKFLRMMPRNELRSSMTSYRDSVNNNYRRTDIYPLLLLRLAPCSCSLATSAQVVSPVLLAAIGS
jgi:hypothetical protein